MAFNLQLSECAGCYNNFRIGKGVRKEDNGPKKRKADGDGGGGYKKTKVTPDITESEGDQYYEGMTDDEQEVFLGVMQGLAALSGDVEEILLSTVQQWTC